MMASGTRVAVALLHHPVYGRQQEVVTTSVTGSDIHDIARIARTYGVSPFYIVNPVTAQREMVEAIKRHWFEEVVGHPRTEALSLVLPVPSLADATADLARRAGGPVRLVATSARLREGVTSYKDLASRIRAAVYPAVLLLFGTGWGLTEEVIAQAEERLEAIDMGTGFNHLPVRAAVAIILDRLLGSRLSY